MRIERRPVTERKPHSITTKKHIVMTMMIRKNRVMPEMNTLMSDLFDDFFTRSAAPLRTHLPAANIVEGEKAYEVHLAVPGMEKSDFKIELEGQLLTVSAEKKEEQVEEGTQVHRREFAYTSFTRSFTLPKDRFVPDGIEADYSAGVLKIFVPKSEPSTKAVRSIAIK